MQNILNFVIAGVLLQQVIAEDVAPVPPPLTQCTGSHQIYNECGSACAPTCDNYKDKSLLCIDVCIDGCFCEPGYVKNTVTDTCVLESECPATTIICTGSHEVYNDCGSACPTTCDNYNGAPFACMAVCAQGCFCEPGYVKNTVTDTCVLPTECPVATTQCTKSHEFHNECGTSCPLTCDNYKTPPPCTRQCADGCFCEPGYVRNSVDECVLPEECPQASETQCPLNNQVYKECGTACPLTCDNLLNPPTVCTMQCVIGCACEPGYVERSATDKSCCLPEECNISKPKVIEPQPTIRCTRPRAQPCCKGPNEVYNSCGTLCPKTCATKDVMFKCRSGCQPGCYCADGYLRNSNNVCVPIKKCN